MSNKSHFSAAPADTIAITANIVYHAGFPIELNLCVGHLTGAHSDGTFDRETGPSDGEDVCDLCEPAAAL